MPLRAYPVQGLTVHQQTSSECRTKRPLKKSTCLGDKSAIGFPLRPDDLGPSHRLGSARPRKSLSSAPFLSSLCELAKISSHIGPKRPNVKSCQDKSSSLTLLHCKRSRQGRKRGRFIHSVQTVVAVYSCQPFSRAPRGFPYKKLDKALFFLKNGLTKSPTGCTCAQQS